jgi:pimeloyl-ACP methyl ester carboxylesterase
MMSSLRYTLQNHVRDIICLMDDLGLEKVVLGGHSLGAFISLAFASEYPDRVDRLILKENGKSCVFWRSSILGFPSAHTSP